jgi:hypothetical protein
LSDSYLTLTQTSCQVTQPLKTKHFIGFLVKIDKFDYF